jgi:hypothetical protein
LQYKILIMGLPVNDKKNGKLPGKAAANTSQGSKFIAKPSKAVGVSKKPIKTGGSRGS